MRNSLLIEATRPVVEIVQNVDMGGELKWDSGKVDLDSDASNSDDEEIRVPK